MQPQRPGGRVWSNRDIERLKTLLARYKEEDGKARPRRKQRTIKKKPPAA